MVSDRSAPSNELAKAEDAGGLPPGKHRCSFTDSTGKYNRSCKVTRDTDGRLALKAPGTELNPDNGFSGTLEGGPDNYRFSGKLTGFDSCVGTGHRPRRGRRLRGHGQARLWLSDHHPDQPAQTRREVTAAENGVLTPLPLASRAERASDRRAARCFGELELPMRHPLLVLSPSLLASLALACAGKPAESNDGVGDGIESLSGFESEDESDDMSSDTTPKLDTVSDEGEGTAESGDTTQEGCKKVDLLFVIDNSGSMADEQINLVNSFPAFIDEIQTQLEDTDGYHIGVITSDAYLFNQGCTQEGAMVTATGGIDSSMAVCGPYVEGHRYMTEMDDLDQTFACAGQVGTGGDGNERPMQTMIAALSPAMNGAGGCNEGFLRDDALLVIVIITDEEDDHEIDGCAQLPQPGSNGEPGGWYAGVVAAKNGLEKNIVVLSLVGPPGPNPAACPTLDKCAGGIEGAEVANRVVSFTSMFTHGIIGRICEPSYAGFFAAAVSVIDSACDDFDPIG